MARVRALLAALVKRYPASPPQRGESVQHEGHNFSRETRRFESKRRVCALAFGLLRDPRMTHLSKTKFLSTIVALGLLVGVSACADDDPIESLDQYTDCMDICNAYADCIDDDYDVEACEDRCSDKDYNNDNNQVDQCEDCLDDKSCTNAVFQCGADCAPIVP
jgi:hypothetical protein